MPLSRRSARRLAAAALLLVPAGASAHRLWLLPSATVFAGPGDWVTVDAAVSDDLFFPDHQPGRLEQMQVRQPDGTPGALQNGSTGRFRSVFDVKLDKPGTWRIGTDSATVVGSFKLDGVERRVGRFGPPGGQGARGPGDGGRPEGGARGEGRGEGRGGPDAAPGGPARLPPVAVEDIPAAATDVHLTEVSMRNEVFVTAGEPTTAVFRPTGKGIELSPITHPDELIAGQPARFRFLVDGRPAPGLKVTVTPGGKRYRNDEGAREMTTGADGVVSVSWPAAGMYWLNATATDDKPSAPRATERRLSYATTLEVLAP